MVDGVVYTRRLPGEAKYRLCCCSLKSKTIIKLTNLLVVVYVIVIFLFVESVRIAHDVLSDFSNPTT